MYLLHENEELDGKSSQRPSSPATSSTKSIVVWPHSVDSPEEEEGFHPLLACLFSLFG